MNHDDKTQERMNISLSSQSMTGQVLEAHECSGSERASTCHKRKLDILYSPEVRIKISGSSGCRVVVVVVVQYKMVSLSCKDLF